MEKSVGTVVGNQLPVVPGVRVGRKGGRSPNCSAIVAAVYISVVIYGLTDVIKVGRAQPGAQEDLRDVKDTKRR